MQFRFFQIDDGADEIDSKLIEVDRDAHGLMIKLKGIGGMDLIGRVPDQVFEKGIQVFGGKAILPCSLR